MTDAIAEGLKARSANAPAQAAENAAAEELEKEILSQATPTSTPEA
jgi:small subunit ribosomal protein S2